MRLLAIEDEPKVGHALQEGLRAEGYEALLTRTGEEGFFPRQQSYREPFASFK